MVVPILATKLYLPPSRPKAVQRSRLIRQLNEGLHRKLTLIAAPAGFGKTTLVSEWVASCERPSAWLSLDEGDNDLTRFLTYLIAALQTMAPAIGEGVLRVLHASQAQLPSNDSILTTLINEITTIPKNFILVLDDYHVIDAKSINHVLGFLLEHLPPRMHLVIATREDPGLPLARLRARSQLSELRVADLRFTLSETAEFLNQVMGIDLSARDILALETRTEGWIAGLQLAAISMQGYQDTSSFVKSFTGSHHFVMDYLVEEVLKQQPKSVHTFLLCTSILDRLCGPLCDAVLLGPSGSGQETLEALEHANLFIVPLDNERRWYRYHHLFADLLRQRLQQNIASSPQDVESRVNELHIRASQWFEDHSLELEAFQHAAAAHDVERAARLMEGKGIPLHFRGVVTPVLHWLESLPKKVLEARPSLWVTYASALLFGGQHTAAELKLQAAEAALSHAEQDEGTRDLVGRIASIRATLAVIQHDAETIIGQSRRALEYLHPDNRSIRTATTWTLGYAYQLQGDRAAASKAYTEVISIGESFGDSIYTTVANINRGQLQEADNQLHLATKTYRRVLQLAGDPPQQFACEAYLGLARIHYQWNDLDAAQQYGQQCLQLTQQMERVDTFASYGVFLASLKLAQGDLPGATAILVEAEEFVRQHNFLFRMPDVAAAQVLTLLHQGNLKAATHLAEMYQLPMSQVRVHLAQRDPFTALAMLGPLRQQAEAKGWPDERLKVMVLQAIAHHAHGEDDQAVRVLEDALVMAEPGGFIRIFVDEGLPMVQLLSEAAIQGILPDYVGKLRAAFKAEQSESARDSHRPAHISPQPLIEPLTERELEVLRLLGTELTGPEIARELMVSLNTMHSHTKNIYTKLGVNNRRAAIRRAGELDLL